MSQITLQKLEKLNAQIQKLEHEKKVLTENLKKSLLNILNDDFIISYDFETLVGGMLSVKAILNESTEASKKVKESWKKEGVQYFQKNKKTATQKK